jgi:hypothetical protein
MATNRIVSVRIAGQTRLYTPDVLTISMTGQRGGGYSTCLEWDEARKMVRKMAEAIRAHDAETGFTDPGLVSDTLARRTINNLTVG